jgi:hypothetical protein
MGGVVRALARLAELRGDDAGAIDRHRRAIDRGARAGGLIRRCTIAAAWREVTRSGSG